MRVTARPDALVYRAGLKPATGTYDVDNTITEQDLDASAQHFVQQLRGDVPDVADDLDVDGLTDSLMSRLFSLFMFRSR